MSKDKLSTVATGHRGYLRCCLCFCVEVWDSSKEKKNSAGTTTSRSSCCPTFLPSCPIRRLDQKSARARKSWAAKETTNDRGKTRATLVARACQPFGAARDR